MRRLLAVGFACALLISAACVPRQPVPRTGQDPATPLSAMSAEQKRTDIAAGFPIEVPVVSGRVVRGRAQGDMAWDYELIADGSPQQVHDFYLSAYTGREWYQTGGGPATGAQASTSLSFVKGQAQSRIDISEAEGGSRVVGVVGLGTPVIQSQ